MKPRIKVITLAVSDLRRSLTFYRDGMGLPTEGIVGTEFEAGAVVFFNLNDDLILALYPRATLAKDARIAVGPPSATELSIGHNVRSKQDPGPRRSPLGNRLESAMGGQGLACHGQIPVLAGGAGSWAHAYVDALVTDD